MLAIKGGKKIRETPFPSQETIGEEEKKAITDLLDTKKSLSNYRGSWRKEFYGGEQIQCLEEEWSNYFGVKHAIATNSCTSSLIISCGAIDIQPSDEIIVTPWSMSCSATAPMWWGGTPIFVDIEKDYFCLDPDSIRKKITKKTKAIIAVDLFGQPYNVPEINKIAGEYGLYIIEDIAQAIGSSYVNSGNKEYSGTLGGDIGCFSLTTGKHLTAGEGGMIITNDDELALRCRLIMNHGEAVINDMTEKINQFDFNQNNIVGFNMRMTEIQAAITRIQLKKLNRFVKERQKRVEYINDKLSDIPFIIPSKIREGCTHSYYVHAFTYNNQEIHRNKYIDAINAELSGEKNRLDRPLLGCGYIQPIYLFPLYKKKMHWTLKQQRGTEKYYKGLCPTAENLWENDLFLSMFHNLPLTKDDMDDIVNAFHKVHENIKEIL